MKHRTKRFTAAMLLSLLLTLVMIISAVAANLVIDAFDTPGPTITLTFLSPGTQNGNGSAPGGLGGERDVVVTASATTTNDSYGFRVETGGGASKLSIETSASVRATTNVIWDGTADADKTVVDPSGLGGIDFVDGTNDGFHLEAIYNDNPVQIVMHVWENSTGTEATASINLPAGITIDDHVDFFIPFASFSPAIDFTDVGAVMLEINAQASPGADLELDFLDADNFRDFGDAPFSYGAVSHIANGLRLGDNVDIEGTPVYSPNADGDDLDQAPPNDEDGVTRTTGVTWTPTGTGSIDIVVKGCQQTSCYINGWIDWDSDGVFDNADRIIDDLALPNGNFSGSFIPGLTFNVPAGVDYDNPILARFRICNTQNACDIPTGEIPGGEVEDYSWGFGPTAVTLSSLSARSTLSTGMIAAVVAAGLLVLVAVYAAFAVRRRRAG